MAQQKPNGPDTEPRCIFGCKKYRTLRTVPINDSCRENWKKLLNLKVLRAQHKVCDQHFQNGTPEFNLPIDTQTPRYKKCVLRCRSYARLHKVPDDDELLELWRQRLKVKTLLKSHRVCSNHFKKARTKFIRTRELPDSPEPSDDDNETMESKKTPNPVQEKTENVTQNEQDNHIEVWLMDALGRPISAGDEAFLDGVDNEKEGNSDEILDDETLNKYMKIVGKSTTDNESGNFSLNWGVLGEEIEGPRSIVPNYEDTEDYDSSSNMIVQTDDNDISSEDYPSKGVTLTIERLDIPSLEQNDEEIVKITDDTKKQTNENDNESLDSEGLEEQFRAIDKDSLIVDELEDKVKSEGSSSRRRNSLNAPIYAPSRSHALQSWLNTPDFCIVRKTRNS